MPVKKMFAQEINGKYNLKHELTENESFVEAVEAMQENGGYWLESDRDGEGLVFVPWHSIEFIRE